MVYAIDARTGVEVARRVLPDPGAGVRRWWSRAACFTSWPHGSGEPIYWYALSAADLVPRHRRIVSLSSRPRRCARGVGDSRRRTLARARDAIGGGLQAHARLRARGRGRRRCSPRDAGRFARGPAGARDACAGGRELFGPRRSTGPRERRAGPPGAVAARSDRGEGGRVGLGLRDGRRAASPDPRHRGRRRRMRRRRRRGSRQRADRARVEAFAVDRDSGAVAGEPWATASTSSPQLGDGGARGPPAQRRGPLPVPRARRCPLLAAALRAPGRQASTSSRWARAAGTSSTPRWAIWSSRTGTGQGRPGGGGRLRHRSARVASSAVAPRPAGPSTLGDLGGATTVYAGAGAVVVRGARSVTAVRM